MWKVTLLIVLTLFFTNLMAQDETVKKLQEEASKTIKKDPAVDTLAWKWKRGGVVNLNVSQGSLKNWAAGGDKFSLTLNTYVNYFVFHRHGKRSWDNNLDFNFGFVQSTSLGSRKNDDRLDLLSKYGYNFDGKWNVTGLVNLRSQFFDGYTYTTDRPTFSSTFLSPAYLLASAGLDYKPNERFSFFISPLTSRWVFVLNDYLASKGSYGVDSGKRAAYEFGAFASLNYKLNVMRNVTYKARVDLFSNYLHNPKNIDLFMTNFFAFKINRFLSASYNLDLIYDDDVRLFGKQGKSPALQLKSLLGIGILMPI